jgi:hypothetical protein
VIGVRFCSLPEMALPGWFFASVRVTCMFPAIENSGREDEIIAKIDLTDELVLWASLARRISDSNFGAISSVRPPDD